MPDPEFARSAAQFLMQHEGEVAGGRWAAVSNQPTVYGMQRMFTILSEAQASRRRPSWVPSKRGGGCWSGRTEKVEVS